MTVLDTLQAAREDLLTHGWNQGDFFANARRSEHPADAPACLEGACYRAANWNYPLANDAINSMADTINMSLPYFNDQICKSLNDALAALDTAILVEKEKLA